MGQPCAGSAILHVMRESYETNRWVGKILQQTPIKPLARYVLMCA
jgi:hypothetical protein